MSASAQAVLTPIVVTAPVFSPFHGPTQQLLNLFMQQIPNNYSQQGLARRLCEESRSRSNSLRCNRTSDVPSAEQFFRDALSGTFIANSGRTEYEQGASAFGYYCQNFGANAPSAALDNLASVCTSTFGLSRAAQCLQEMDAALNRSV
jgi:hypothetical protein